MLSELVHWKILRDFMTTKEANQISLVSKEANYNVNNAPWNDSNTSFKGSLKNWRRKFPFATAINVGGNRQLFHEDFLLLQKYIKEGLTSINISHNFIDDSEFGYLEGVKILNMSHCRHNYVLSHGVSVALSREAFQSIKGIHTLDISGCEIITDELFESLQGIHTLIMSRCGQISGQAFKWLKGIHTLDMSECTQISGDAFRHLSGIQRLNMSYCQQPTITDDAFKFLKGIRFLKMSSCSQASITDEAFRSLQGIHTLDMSNCRQITGAALRFLKGIHTLIMSGCHFITGENFRLLKGIHSLNVTECGKITAADILSLGFIDTIKVYPDTDGMNNGAEAAKVSAATQIAKRVVPSYKMLRSSMFTNYDLDVFKAHKGPKWD